MAELLHRGAKAVGSSGTALTVDGVFSDCLERLWEGGWQPFEVVRAVRRSRSAAHADLVVTSVAAWHGYEMADKPGCVPPPDWSRQLSEIGADDRWWGTGRDWLLPWALRSGTTWPEALITAVEALGAMVGLPLTEILIPPPSEWGQQARLDGADLSAVDDAVLAKVRALLAKAESTTFTHEADALTAKAQELIARHSIDEAMARSSAGKRVAPGARRFAVDDP